MASTARHTLKTACVGRGDEGAHSKEQQCGDRNWGVRRRANDAAPGGDSGRPPRDCQVSHRAAASPEGHPGRETPTGTLGPRLLT